MPDAPNLSRLLRPKTIAVIGGGTWCQNIFAAAKQVQFRGEIFAVHPKRSEIAGHKTYPSLAALPQAPDAAFIGVNRQTTVEIARELRKIGAGGAIAFASGFREAGDDDQNAIKLEADLLTAAGDMPILGPNCYGFVNALDGAALWPDQHGCVPVKRGVAIVAQSSNLAINLSMQRRGLPIGYLITAGNQAQTSLADICNDLAGDPRVTAIGLHVEGFGDLAAFEAMARTIEKPIVVLKVGASEQAQSASISHTASMAGSHVGATALLARLGIGQAPDIETFLESLSLLHVAGPLTNTRVTSMSCSGGEASLVADAGLAADIEFPALDANQIRALGSILGPKVSLANPLDYHTYIWGDVPKMAAMMVAMAKPDCALNMLVLDLPRDDLCDPSAWNCALEALDLVQNQTNARFALLTSMPEGLPEPIAAQLIDKGVVPLAGFSAGLKAIAIAAQCRPQTRSDPILHAHAPHNPQVVLEHQAKELLRGYLPMPPNAMASNPNDISGFIKENSGPFVLKSTGSAHKSDMDGVRLDVDAEDTLIQADALGYPVLIETMISDKLAELLVCVIRDPAHGFVLTLGAGGTLTEILADTTHLLVPAAPDQIETALAKLRIAPILQGYRGKPAVDIKAVVAAIEGIQGFVKDHADKIEEVEINPLICTSDGAFAADALIRMDLATGGQS